ncbi:MAG: hypothetical protein ACOX6E_05975 [Syntrophomonadaceae bacterium]|jgi:uncharacterized membrane protein (DUF485 family)
MKGLIIKLMPDRRPVNDNELQQALRPVVKHIRRQHYLYALIRAVLLAMAVSLFMTIYSFIRPWVDVSLYCWVSAGVVLSLALLIAAILRPGLWEVAAMLDRKGLKERVITALELSAFSSSSNMQRWQKEDALRHLRTFDMASNCSLSFPQIEVKVMAVLTVLLLVLNVIPNPQQEEVDRLIAVREVIKQQEKQVEKVRNELSNKNEKNPSEKREEGIDLLEDLQQKLQSSQKQEQAMRSLASTEEELKKLTFNEADSLERDLNRLSQALKQEETSRRAGEKLALGDSREIEKSFADLADKMDKFTGAERQKMVSSLNDAAADITDARLKGQLSSTAAALNSGTARTSGAELAALGGMLGQLSAQARANRDLQQAQMALQSARTAIASAASSGNSGSVASATANCGHPACNASGGNGT